MMKGYLNDVICLHLNSDLHCICKRSWVAVEIVTIVTIVWVTIIIYNPNLAPGDSLQLYLSQGTQWLYFPAKVMWLWWLSGGWENSQRFALAVVL